ncbi:MAG: hypothetical protein HOQ30_11215 [Gemmatimonadaceae bacterium]|nr:hypothetical protein [Gemmatimonadaceae bacterium]
MTMPSDSGAPAIHLMGQAIPLATHVDRTPSGGARTEGSLTQAVLMARAGWWHRRATLDATIDAEGFTMRSGELSLGAFGEGFVDRRHPHTYLHELMLGLRGHAGPGTLSLGAGRGFAPFGTDDPMVRPFAKYPINHHLAQVLERGIVVGAARVGPAIVEAGSFTGEEPQRASSLPLARRFGDSWSVRGTIVPRPWAELQTSYARIASPEQADGFGLDQRKQSVSARAVSSDGGRYALVEWARTVEYDHTRREAAFSYESVLVESAWRAGAFGVAVRLEQTDRPEEERLADPFRTARPATDLHIAGITRWRTATAAVAAPAVTWGTVVGVPFLELSRLAATARDTRTLFDPDIVYGRSHLWMLTGGVRVRAGATHSRMGRYGVAVP